MFKVEIERPMCISCGNCINECPEFFEFADDGLSHLKWSEVNDNEERMLDDPECCLDAEERCPVSIIHVTEI